MIRALLVVALTNLLAGCSIARTSVPPSGAQAGPPSTGPSAGPSSDRSKSPSSPPQLSASEWDLVWAEDFDGPAGSAPDPGHWGYDLGDGTANGIPGWGNNERQLYTDDPANAALDGDGNLVITARGADGSADCYYGPCQYTSARLLTKNRFEAEYGRIEARIKVPTGAGLWPAFWMLGTNINTVGWPQSGEIDVMEHVGKLPNRLFATIHGPGYAGSSGFGSTIDLPAPVADEFHTFALEWRPDRLVWTVDGIAYHDASPENVAPNKWVFNHPFFLILNVAVGGHFGGPVGPETSFPQSMSIDYVRVYRASA